jgi:hypothetical protein
MEDELKHENTILCAKFLLEYALLKLQFKAEVLLLLPTKKVLCNPRTGEESSLQSTNVP